jgi:hypothetical protein
MEMQHNWLLPALTVAVATTTRPAPDCCLALKDLVAETNAQEQSDLRAFYEPAGYHPAWVPDGKPTCQAEEIIRALQAADAKGLMPKTTTVPG